MATAPALLLAAAGVGFGHAILPDHWAPLAVLARARRYPHARVARLSLLAGTAHVALSLVLGALVMGIGLQFRSSVQHHQDLIVGGLLLATGAVLLALQATGHGHDHGHSAEHSHHHDGDREPARGRARRLASFVVPFGAAASPDLTILPVFVAASGVSTLAASGTLVVFSLVTIATIMTATIVTAAGANQLRSPWIDKAANLLTAFVVLIIGALIATHVL